MSKVLMIVNTRQCEEDAVRPLLRQQCSQRLAISLLEQQLR